MGIIDGTYRNVKAVDSGIRKFAVGFFQLFVISFIIVIRNRFLHMLVNHFKAMLPGLFLHKGKSAYDRSVLALKLKPLIAAQAKEQQGTRTDISQKSVKSHDTQKELAKVAGVSHDTIHKVERIEAQAPESTKQALRQGKTTINKAYNATFPKRPDAVTLAKQEHEEFEQKKQEKEVIDFSEVKRDKLNQEIINGELELEIRKMLNVIENFGFRHSLKEVGEMAAAFTIDYTKELIDRIMKNRAILAKIENTLRTNI